MKNILLLLLLWYGSGMAQPPAQLPVFERNRSTPSVDWLVDSLQAKAALYQTPEGWLVFSNGLVSRTFVTTPNCASVSLDLLTKEDCLLRSVRAEAELTLNGIAIPVGGLEGQPIHNYLLPEWIGQMKAIPGSFQLINYSLGEIRERFPWKKRLNWMPKDLPWPAPGKELIFNYSLPESARQMIVRKSGNKFTSADLELLDGVIVSVHYELYDNMPLFCKWVTLENKTAKPITVDRFKSEILAATEPESEVDGRKNWSYPNLELFTDYNFGGVAEERVFETSAIWKPDSLYLTQVNYERSMPCLLEVAPKIGPAQKIAPGDTFSSYRVWELLNDSRDQERKGLEERRTLRTLAPWVTENPILMHVRQADDAAVKKAIDQCAAVGFEMVIMTFGSGFNLEDTTTTNLARLKKLADYAHSYHIALGGYSLLASRTINKKEDILLPAGEKPRFGNSPCLVSEWGENYFRKLYHFYQVTGLDILEHDGNYPGDWCYSTQHPGHKGVADSQWNQHRQISSFYNWCRAKGIYLNVPDNYYLNGSNKCGMGYRETNWSLPRAQQEIIERQNIYDGTWRKTPSMGWMFVPLVEYQGGGAAATIEPLREHLAHYNQRLANLFGAGVQACYRGPELYDAPETREMVAKWVRFYKDHRTILDGDILHIRRPDGRDYDAILHVDVRGEEKGLLMVYNPLDHPIQRKILISLYYTGLKESAVMVNPAGESVNLALDSRQRAWVDCTIGAKSQTWFIFKK